VKTQYYTAASLDGFIATPDDSLEWLFPLGDIESTSYPAFIREVGALAMGSVTYEWMLKHIVGPEAKRPQPWPYTQPTWVFSSRARAAIPGADIRVVRGDVRPVHEEMVSAARGISPPLRLISVKAVGTGFAELRYEVPLPPAAQSSQ
jgi:dihydrofolate reductase